MCFTFILLVTITLVPCQILTKKNKYKMNYNSRAVGCKNGEPGVLPSGVEAKPAPTFLRGHFLKLLSIFYCFYRSSWSQRKSASALVPFVSRQKTLANSAAMSG
jgi:hypothetical protein